MKIGKMSDVDLKNKRVLIREDLNVPIKEGFITSAQRLEAAIPTLKQALDQNAAVIVLSHLGRPEEGRYDSRYSLRPVAEYLRAHLDYPIHFASHFDEINPQPGELVLFENIRFLAGEKNNEETLAKKLASLCDIYVMDAFGTAHRKHASTYGVAQFAPCAVAGPLLVRELEALNKVLHNPSPPIMAIVGGAKVSTKLSLLRYLCTFANFLIPGGGIANTFLKAQGFEIGLSLYEESLISEAKAILEEAEKNNCKIILPVDVVVSKQFSAYSPAYNKSLSYIAADDMILDIGPETINLYLSYIPLAKTIIWNGPVGVFEFPQFSYGTRAVAIAIADSGAFTIAGGGDTLAAIDQYDLPNQISYISTGGGAFLECLEGKTLPAVAILEKRNSK